MWKGKTKGAEMVQTRDLPPEEQRMLPIANARVSDIVHGHFRLDSPISRIAEDCYLQGVRDAVQSIQQSGSRIVFPGEPFDATVEISDG